MNLRCHQQGESVVGETVQSRGKYRWDGMQKVIIIPQNTWRGFNYVGLLSGRTVQATDFLDEMGKAAPPTHSCLHCSHPHETQTTVSKSNIRGYYT